MLYQYLDTQLVFIHIPRTGGRHVNEILSCNIDCVFHSYDQYNAMFGGSKLLTLNSSFAHSSISQMKYLIDPLPDYRFSVIRNPLDKFKSSFGNEKYHLFANTILAVSSYDEFVYYMERESFKYSLHHELKHVFGFKNTYDKFFVPQVDFIDNSVKLWKFENRFNEKFYTWVLDKFNVPLNIEKNVPRYRVIDYVDNKTDLDISSLLLKFIERYYEKDFELWESLNG